MIKELVLFILISLGAVVALFILKGAKSNFPLTEKVPETTESKDSINTTEFTNNAMVIKSSEFTDNQRIPVKYTCNGADVNPPLTFENIPSTAQSLVLIVDDPDSPTKAWTHWILFNLPPTMTTIDENTYSITSEIGINDFGHNDYGGPCPATGTHRYNFMLYALDSFLNLNTGATKNDVLDAMNNHIIAQARLVGLYGK